MAQLSLAELTTAAAASDCHLGGLRYLTIELGGVDPLGLRQINFDLMDQFLPTRA